MAMVSSRRRGFTLVELLVVITIICILIVMLLPALMGVWQTVYATQCKSHLNQIFQAMVLWQQDKNSVVFPHGPGWNGSLLPYIENRMDVFLCPASPGPLDTSSGTVTQTSGGGSSGGGSGGTGGSSEAAPPQLAGFDISFDVFSNGQFTNFLWNVSFNSSWCRHTANYAGGSSDMPASYTWRYQIEDRGFLVEQTGDWKWADDYADIDVAVTYDNGSPTFIKIIQSKHGSQGYRYNMLINGQMIVHNIDDHNGMVIDLRPPQSGQPTGTSGNPGSDPTTVTTVTASSYYYFPCDYAMSVGSYSATLAAGSGGTQSTLQDVPRVDAKLFLLLDYPKRLANFNVDGEDYGQGDKYFITDPVAWRATYDQNNAGLNWRQYQALRHFKMSNVLFCDGHVEILPYIADPGSDEAKSKKFLQQDSPLWVYGKPVSSY
jgi:prepilin-type N-terminal cleavage/methylation domain-containing protein/prepilin-type processing-associated H-X9-DG protein